MTIETLEKYRGIVMNVESLRAEIDALYVPVSSPNGRTDTGSFSGAPSDPTGRAVNKILKLKEDLSEELMAQVKLLEEITDWMLETEKEDPEVVSLVRLHYVAGYTWRQTNEKAYGYPDYHTARKKVFRYFGRQ